MEKWCVDKIKNCGKILLIFIIYFLQADQDMPMVSSAPSSAYYSDLSVTAVPTERAYEVVGLTVMSSPLPNWDNSSQSCSTQLHPLHHTLTISQHQQQESPMTQLPQNTNLMLGRRSNRLSAINESSTIPSDYV